MAQQVVIGRQQGQGFLVSSPEGTQFHVEVEKCCNGYTRLRVECNDSFEVHRWDGEKREKMRSQKGGE